MNRKEKFIYLLREYGVKEYWSTGNFDPKEKYPSGTILIPIENKELKSKIRELYSLGMWESSSDYLTVNTYEYGSFLFNLELKQLREFEYCEYHKV